MNDRTATWKLLEDLAVKSVVESRKQVGLATLCVASGMGAATIIELM